MVEVVIILFIVAIISSLVLASFSGLSSRIYAQRSTQRLALSLRRAQNMAFGVRQVLDTVPSSPTFGSYVIPGSYGIYFNLGSPTSYLIFADTAPSADPDGRYTSGSDIAIETVQLDPGISLQSLVTQSGGGNQNILNVAFAVPEATVSIKRNSGGNVGNWGRISLIDSRGAFPKSATVYQSGQIYVR